MPVYLHPLYIRICHWVNAVAIFVMVTSGWRIYNSSPIFDFVFPKSITLGGWLAGALMWHFAAMWVLVINGLIYLIVNIVSGRLWTKFFPLRPRELLADFRDALMLRLHHTDLTHYNAIQKGAYLSVILAIVIVILSGLAVWKSVQFPHLRELMGGYDNARIVHFFAMAYIVFFFVIHVVMVAIVPQSLKTMIGSLNRKEKTV